MWSPMRSPTADRQTGRSAPALPSPGDARAVPALARLRHVGALTQRPRRRAAAGLRPRRRRVHEGAASRPRRHRTPALALERAKLRAAQDHFTRGRRLAATGKLEEALVEFQIAVRAEPGQRRHRRGAADDPQPAARQGGRRPRGQDRARDARSSAARDLPPPGLDCRTDVKLPDVARVPRREQPRRLHRASRASPNINLVFDSGVPRHADHDRPAQRHARGRADAVAGSTRNFYRVTAPRTVTVIPDTPAKRREYEEEVVRTFYLSNADLKETIDLLRIVVDARRICADRRPPTRSRSRTRPSASPRPAACITAIDKARPEVVIDVELLEVDRTQLHEYGLQIASPGLADGINGSADVNRERPDAARPAQPDAGRRLPDQPAGALLPPAQDRHATRGRWPTRSCARRRASPAQARFGERVPVPVTTFAPIAHRRRATSSRSRRSTTRTSASTSTSRRARTTTTTCRWR